MPSTLLSIFTYVVSIVLVTLFWVIISTIFFPFLPFHCLFSLFLHYYLAMPTQSFHYHRKRAPHRHRGASIHPIESALSESFKSHGLSPPEHIQRCTANSNSSSISIAGFTDLTATSSDSASLYTAPSDSGHKSKTDEHPRRPGVADCDHYIKCGRCSYGERCKFNHPPRTHQLLEALARKECYNFLKGFCQYGDNCKYLHPERCTQFLPPSQIDAGACIATNIASTGFPPQSRSPHYVSGLLCQQNAHSIRTTPSATSQFDDCSIVCQSVGMTSVSTERLSPSANRATPSTPAMWPALSMSGKEETYSKIPHLDLQWLDKGCSPTQDLVKGGVDGNMNEGAPSSLSSQYSTGYISPAQGAHVQVELGRLGGSIAVPCNTSARIGCSTSRVADDRLCLSACVGSFVSLLATQMLNRNTDCMVDVPGSPWSRIGRQDECQYGKIGEGW